MIKMERTVLLSLLTLVCFGCGSVDSSSSVASVRRDELPEGWHLQNIVRAALRPGETAESGDVLCWQIREDGRPLRVESCILWLRLAGVSTVAWRVSHIYRHPLEKNQWYKAVVDDAPIPHEREFDHPPSSAEVLAFIDATEWEWALVATGMGSCWEQESKKMREIAGFRCLDGRVCRGIWRGRTGSAFDLEVPPEYLR
jgi:hypothetical protein